MMLGGFDAILHFSVAFVSTDLFLWKGHRSNNITEYGPFTKNEINVVFHGESEPKVGFLKLWLVWPLEVTEDISTPPSYLRFGGESHEPWAQSRQWQSVRIYFSLVWSYTGAAVGPLRYACVVVLPTASIPR
jgi:hypothetical protein